MEDDGERRPKRRAARNNAAASGSQAPSAVHYLGYVEDEESVEMIMKKFETLERIKTSSSTAAKPEAEEAEAGPSPEEAAEEAIVPAEGLSEEQMLELFKETSNFTVRGALSAYDAFYDEGFTADGDKDGDDMYDEDDEEEDDEDDFWGEGKSSSKGRRGGSSGVRRVKDDGGARARMAAVLSQRGSQLVMTKRVRAVDPFEILQIRVPNAPIPISWGRTIAPYVPKGKEKVPEHTVYGEEKDMLDGKSLQKYGKDFIAVLLNPPFAGEFSSQVEGTKGCTVAALKSLDLPTICPIGFIFIWVDKAVLSDVVYLMEKWNYVYVENLTYVQVLPNNKLLCDKYTYLCTSHRTLMIFRRSVPSGKSIELRHQRSPDVTCDFIRSPLDGRRMETPGDAYTAIETLLPTAYDGKGRGQFLELWAGKDAKRAGWTMVHQPKA